MVSVIRDGTASPVAGDEPFGDGNLDRVAGLLNRIETAAQNLDAEFLGHYCAGDCPAVLARVASLPP